MTKKHFIALADTIRVHNRRKLDTFGCNALRMLFNVEQLSTLADFCEAQNSRFNRERWLGYINGECGPSGGKR
jgi:hypothetical protein